MHLIVSPCQNNKQTLQIKLCLFCFLASFSVHFFWFLLRGKYTHGEGKSNKQVATRTCPLSQKYVFLIVDICHTEDILNFLPLLC